VPTGTEDNLESVTNASHITATTLPCYLALLLDSNDGFPPSHSPKTFLGGFGHWANGYTNDLLNLCCRKITSSSRCKVLRSAILDSVEYIFGYRLSIKSWRVVPLIAGLYPFLVMFPLLIITGHPDLAAIMG